MNNSIALTHRAYGYKTTANSWEELWEAEAYYERVAELLEDAHDSVIFVGWQLDSRLQLKKPNRSPSLLLAGTERESLREKVVRLCEQKPGLQIYFLVWDHAYLYVYERELWQGRVWENAHPRVHFVFDNRHPFGGCHHEKVTLIDSRVALCGGIDLCDDRWDSKLHHHTDVRRSLFGNCEHHGPYHDMGVQVTGPVCVALQDHIARRWEALSSIPFPREKKPGNGLGHQVYLSRTIAEVDRSPKKNIFTREVEFLFRDLIRSAESRILLEGQYYWSEVINDLLISKMLEMKGKEFEIIMIIAELKGIHTFTRYMAYYQQKLLLKLIHIAEFTGTHLTMGSPYVLSNAGESFPPKSIYIHSKTLIIDDRYLCIGSANFATRALRVDTEVHLTLSAETVPEKLHIRRVVNQIISHWNIFERAPYSDIVFRRFNPRIALEELSKKMWIASWIPLERFFDPVLPWFYPIKMGYFRAIYRNRGFLLANAGVIWLLGAACVNHFYSMRFPLQDWSLLFSILFSSVWIFPVPFVGLSVFALFRLGMDQAILLSISGLWAASFSGYYLSRAFPRIFSDWIGLKPSDFDFRKVRRRSFSSLLEILISPRMSVRDKILLQGLGCTPFPWFALSTWVLMPGCIYLFLRIVGWFIRSVP